MMPKNCPHEKEIRELIEGGQWPLAASPELRAHLGECRTCSDLAVVTEAFQNARIESIAAAKLASPGVLLWRAQLRRRNAAVERLTRPLLSAQIFALVVTLVAGLGFVGFEARHGLAWLTWLEPLPQGVGLHSDNLFSASLAGPGWTWMVLFTALATLVLLGGVAVYKATDRQ
jgi:predicted anti-sigma-YlaC factor YlaD